MFAEMATEEPTLRSVQVLKQEAEDVVSYRAVTSRPLTQHCPSVVPCFSTSAQYSKCHMSYLCYM